MAESSLGLQSQSRLNASRMNFKNKNASKLSFYETNMENFSKNQKFNLEKIDPKGIFSVGIYGSFSGVIEDAHLFCNHDQTIMITYKIYMGNEWHDQTPQTDDTQGESHFCQSKGGKVTFSLGFDFLASAMYIINWPKMVLTVKGFNRWGQLVTKGYAHINLPSESGQFIRKAYIYSIIRNERWYHKWLPWECQATTLQQKQVQRVIVNGEGRESQKTKCIGVLNIRIETLLRNFERFGYK